MFLSARLVTGSSFVLAMRETIGALLLVLPATTPN